MKSDSLNWHGEKFFSHSKVLMMYKMGIGNFGMPYYDIL